MPTIIFRKKLKNIIKFKLKKEEENINTNTKNKKRKIRNKGFTRIA